MRTVVAGVVVKGMVVKGVPCIVYKVGNGNIAVAIKNNCFVAYWKK